MGDGTTLPDTTLVFQLVRGAGIMFLCFVLAPLAGATLLSKGLPRIGVSDVPFGRCALAYFNALFAGGGLLIVLEIIDHFRAHEGGKPIHWFVQRSLFVGVQVVLVPLLLGKRTLPVWLLSTGVVLLVFSCFFVPRLVFWVIALLS